MVVPDRSGVWGTVAAGDGKDCDVRLREERVTLSFSQWSWHGAFLTRGRTVDIEARCGGKVVLLERTSAGAMADYSGRRANVVSF